MNRRTQLLLIFGGLFLCALHAPQTWRSLTEPAAESAFGPRTDAAEGLRIRLANAGWARVAPVVAIPVGIALTRPGVVVGPSGRPSGRVVAG